MLLANHALNGNLRDVLAKVFKRRLEGLNPFSGIQPGVILDHPVTEEESVLFDIAKDTPMPSIAGKVATGVVTYSEPQTVSSAQQPAKLASATPLPNVMSRPVVEHVTYDTPHTVLTAQDMAAKGAPMPTIAGKTAGDAVLYSETHTVIESKAEFKSFDISQTAKLNKAQIKNVIENGW